MGEKKDDLKLIGEKTLNIALMHFFFTLENIYCVHIRQIVRSTDFRGTLSFLFNSKIVV